MMLSLELNPVLADLCASVPESLYKDALNKLIAEFEAGRVGFPDLPFDLTPLKKIEDLTESLRKKFSTLVVLGVGGSSLGGQTISRALSPNQPAHRVLFLDNIDPDEFCPIVESLNMKKTAFLIASKSGSTLETWAQWLIVDRILKNHVGANWQSHVFVCTDPKEGDLRSFAHARHLTTFDVPANVGGRFSVLTPVGLVPASFIGLNIHQLLEGAAHLGKPQAWDVSLHPEHLVPQLTRALYAAHKKGLTSHVLMTYCHKLDRLTDWFVQLWAESLGKTVNNVPLGSTPIRALGVSDQHSQMQLFMQGPRDKVIGFLWNQTAQHPGEWGKVDDQLPSSARMLENQSLRQLLAFEFQATRQALYEASRPTYTLTLESLNERSLGELFYLFEAVTVLFGYMLGINPLDQPGVERAKILTKEQLTNG